MDYTESYLEVAPGQKIFYRDYPANSKDAPVLLCLHGLTRNSSDFVPLIDSLEQRGLTGQYRFVIPDMRGRGKSDFDPVPVNYNTLVYAQDCWKLLDSLNIYSCRIVGTSMGGIMAMMMHAEQPSRVDAVLLNDIGPVVAREGLVYILSYLGRDMIEPDWGSAVATTKRRLGSEYPSLGDSEWKTIVQRSYTKEESGSWRLDYDPNIRLPMLDAYQAGAELDLWDLFLAIDKPILCLRGALSRLTPPELAEAMQARNPFCKIVEVPERGHVPLLDEPIVVDAILEWLEAGY